MLTSLKFSTRWLVVTIVASIIPMFATSASAQIMVAGTISGKMKIQSDYRVRGLTRTMNQPSIFGSFDYGFPVGLYIGFNFANVSETQFSGSNIENTLFGGFRGDFNGFGLDLGMRYQTYPDSYTNLTNLSSGSTSKGDTVTLHESYLGVRWEFLEMRANYALNKFLAIPDTQGSYYWDVTARPEIAPGVNLIAHTGYQGMRNYSKASYTDFLLGVRVKINNHYALEVSGITTDTKDEIYNRTTSGGDLRNIGRSGLVVSLISDF